MNAVIGTGLPRGLVVLALLAAALLALPDSSARDPGAPRPGRGWSEVVPPDAKAPMAAVEPQPLLVPAWLHERVKRKTYIFYFSPTCWHCLVAMPELAELAVRLREQADFLAVCSGNTEPERLAAWRATQNPAFDVVYDEGHGFAEATGLDATPALVVARPGAPGKGPLVDVVEAYLPYVRGSAAILEMRARGDPKVVMERGGHQGILTCAACHAEEARSWTLTWHSISYYKLQDAGGLDNPACLRCHTTNLQDPASLDAHGFRPGDHSSPYASVTCEACHGPSGPHDGAPDDPSASCARCHDPARGVPFEFVRTLPAIDHFRSSRFDEVDTSSHRLDMAEGRLPRPGLALPEGENVSADTCRSCHKKEWKAWKKSPHRRAMASLDAGARGKVECLLCHATPLKAGSPPSTVAELRVDEGVSCDACHGPGAAHAQDPRANPLRSLRSEAPECAVEGVCRSCHTPKWDPDWTLRARLAAIRHGPGTGAQ